MLGRYSKKNNMLAYGNINNKIGEGVILIPGTMVCSYSTSKCVWLSYLMTALSLVEGDEALGIKPLTMLCPSIMRPNSGYFWRETGMGFTMNCSLSWDPDDSTKPMSEGLCPAKGWVAGTDSGLGRWMSSGAWKVTIAEWSSVVMRPDPISLKTSPRRSRNGQTKDSNCSFGSIKTLWTCFVVLQGSSSRNVLYVGFLARFPWALVKRPVVSSRLIFDNSCSMIWIDFLPFSISRIDVLFSSKSAVIGGDYVLNSISIT